MSNWPLPGGTGGWDVFGHVTATSTGTVLSSNATQDTYGSWVEFSASAPFDFDACMIAQVPDTIGGSSSDVFSVQIGVGAAASEKAITGTDDGHADVMIFNNATSTGPAGHCVVNIGCRVAKGARISMRLMSPSTGPDVAQFVLYCRRSNPNNPLSNSKCECYPSDGLSTQFTIIPSTTANTVGSYVELAASTVEDWIGFIIVFGDPNSTNTEQYQMGTIAIGAAASEIDILPGLISGAGTLSDFSSGIWEFDYPIPKGTRISARGQSSLATDADREFDVSIIGLVA